MFFKIDDDLVIIAAVQSYFFMIYLLVGDILSQKSKFIFVLVHYWNDD